MAAHDTSVAMPHKASDHDGTEPLHLQFHGLQRLGTYCLRICNRKGERVSLEVRQTNEKLQTKCKTCDILHQAHGCASSTIFHQMNSLTQDAGHAQYLGTDLR